MLSEAEALALLIRQPLLIRRPLLDCDETQIAGFDTDFIAGWIGLAQGQPPVGEGCPRPGTPLAIPIWNQTTGANSEAT